MAHELPFPGRYQRRGRTRFIDPGNTIAAISVSGSLGLLPDYFLWK
jgi:hypothetical protein